MGAQTLTAPLTLLHLSLALSSSQPLIPSYIVASALRTHAQKAAYNTLHPDTSPTPTAVPSSPTLNSPPSQNSSALDLSS